MSAGWVSSDIAFHRTLELLHSDVPLVRVVPPGIKIWRDGDQPIAVFGPVQRPDFVIDESDLPY